MRDIIHEFVGCKDAINNENITSYMSELIDATDKDQKERFFKICSKDHQLRATKHCKGDECGVLPRADCKREEATVGWFHTHPSPGKERLSTNDVLYGIDKDFSCVGYKKQNKNTVLCFDYPYGIPLQELKESSDVFSTIDTILEKGIKRDCEKIL